MYDWTSKTYHDWTFEENYICCYEYITNFIIGKTSEYIVLQKLKDKLKDITESSLRMKMQNIKQIVIEKNLLDNSCMRPLPNFSKENLLAFNKAMQDLNLDLSKYDKSKIKIKIDFDLNGGEGNFPQIFIGYNDELLLESTPHKAGYEFKYWEKKYQGNHYYTLKAHYIPIFDIKANTIRSLTEFGKSLTSLYIPKSIDGKPIYKIGANAFKNSKNLKECVFAQDSVVNTIGNYCFSNCENLEKISFPKYLKTIEFCAFLNCTKIQHLNLPDSIESFGGACFGNCSALSEITLPFVGANRYSEGHRSCIGYLFGYKKIPSHNPDVCFNYEFLIPKKLMRVCITQKRFIKEFSFDMYKGEVIYKE